MLRMIVVFPLLLLLLCSAQATEEIRSPNHVESDTPIDNQSAEGRACGGCGGHTTTTTHIKPDIHDHLEHVHDYLPSHHELLVWVMTKIPVIAFNILGLVILALLLKKLLSDDTGATGYAPTGYAPTGYDSPSSSYAEPLPYNRRSSPSWSLQSLMESPALTYLTKVVTNAIDRHNFIENHQRDHSRSAAEPQGLSYSNIPY